MSVPAGEVRGDADGYRALPVGASRKSSVTESRVYESGTGSWVELNETTAGLRRH